MGKLAEVKTKETAASVSRFLDTIPDVQKRKDCQAILKMMQKAAKAKPKMWGSSIIGFGNKRYKSPTTTREVEWFTVGFSPRKANITIYLVSGIKQFTEELKIFGKHKTGGGCLYINKLEDVDKKVLEKMINVAVKKSEIL